jgi:AcrR family transcriptional regulator
VKVPPDSSLARCREFCGTDGPDLVRAVTALSLGEVGRLVEEIVGLPAAGVPGVPWPAGGHTGARPSNELWPLVNGRAALLSRGANSMTSGSGPAGVNIMSAMSPRDVGANTFSSGVVRALLYSHGLVLEDPLAMASELHHLTPKATKEYSRLFVEAALTSMVEVSELLDEGVVETYFVPTERRRQTRLAETMRSALDAGPLSVEDVWDAFEANYVDGLKPSLRELWRRIRAGDRNPSMDLVEQAAEADVEMLRIFVDVVASIRPSAVIDNTVQVVASALEDVSLLGWRPDVLCNSRLHAQLLYLGTDDPVVRQRVDELAATEVPRLDGLAVSDVVKIRRLSDAFEQWRTDLSLGLDRAHSMRAELGDEVEVAPLIAETLQVARRGLTDEARHLKPASPGFVSFAAGALGGAVGGLLDGLSGAAVGAAGSVAGSLATGVHSVSQREARGVLQRHYVLFDRVEGAG